MDEPTILELKARMATLEEALRQAEIRATVGLLAYEMIHEIRNPLEALSSLTYLAREEADQPEKVRAYLDSAEEQMAHLRYISSKTLRYPKAAFTLERTDLVKVVEAALRIHQRTIGRSHIHLITDLPQPVMAPVHFGEMLQVVSNLLENAIDAVPSDGTIRLRVTAQHNEAHILVADDGHGIPHAYRGSIFKPYFTTKGDRGTGIGLALIEKIVQGHRGRISMHSSVTPGRSGTTFRVSVPTNPEGLPKSH